MLARSVLVAVVGLVAGCGHHFVGRPPTPAEIADINEMAAGDPAGMRLYTVEPVRPIPDAPPPSIRRIVSADQRQLTVVSLSGEVWSLPTSNVAGVTTRSPRPMRAALAGGAGGLGVGAIVALAELVALSGPWPDAPVTASPAPHSPSVGLALGTLIGFTVAGGLAGILLDRHSPTLDSFQFGGGRESAGYAPQR